MNEKLSEARERVHKLERAEKRLVELRAECSKRRERVDVFADRLTREQKDVDRLEEISIQSIWHSLRGDKVEALAEEQHQLVYAKLKRDEAAARLAETEKLRAEMVEAVESLKDAPEDYARLLVEAEQALRAIPGEAGERLKSIADEEQRSKDELREVRQAERAASAAVEALSTVGDQLSAARNWGGIDMMGGGLITTAIKHSHINSARSALARAQTRLRALERELRDVDRLESFTIDISRFATFADYWFDGLMSDWFVQSRIHEARERAMRTLSDVRRIGVDLRAQERRTRTSLQQLVDERQRIVEGNDVSGEGDPH